MVLNTPNGGERWAVGSVHYISWDKGSTSLLNINYSTDGGKNWMVVAANEDANKGSFPWIIPNTPSDRCLVEVVDAYNQNVKDRSNNLFTITSEPYIVVLSPNGGEKWKIGDKQTVTWRSEGIKTVKIEYCTDGGKYWMTLYDLLNAEDGSVSVVVPNTPSLYCLVRVSNAALPSIYDISDNMFVISGQSPLAIINPRPGGFVLGAGNSSGSRYQLANGGNSILNYKIITSYLGGTQTKSIAGLLQNIKEKSSAVNLPEVKNKFVSGEIFPPMREEYKFKKSAMSSSIKTAKPHYTRKAIVLKSWGYSPVWDDLQANWMSYGNMAIEIDYSTFMYVETFTLQDLINSGADVVILSDPAGAYKQFSRDEANALIDYASMGHNIVGTCALFQYESVDNRHLAPLFGLNSRASYSVESFSPEFHYIYNDPQLFHSIDFPYISSGLNYSQHPFSYWDTSYCEGADMVARSYDRKGGITIYNTNSYSAIYISHMPEYMGNTTDASLLYNAIAYTNLYRNWLSAFPTSGEILPSNSAEVQLEVNSANLPEGSYAANAIISTDDPGAPSFSIPVSLTVQAACKPAPKNLVAGDSFFGLVPLTWTTPDGAIDRLYYSNVNKLPHNSIPSKNPKGGQADTISLYKVYFSENSGGPYVFLFDVNPYANMHDVNQNYVNAPLDTIISRYYVVTAVYKDGVESGYSNEVHSTTSWDGQRKFLNYAVNTPQIDGVISAQEWSDALVSDIQVPGIQGPVKLYLKNSSDKLYIALEDLNNITTEDANTFAVYTDLNNDALWPVNANNVEGCYFSDIIGQNTFNYFSSLSGQYPVKVLSGQQVPNPSTMAAKGSFSSGHLMYEMALNINSSQLKHIQRGGNASDIIGLWFAYLDAANSNETYYGGSAYYPYGSVWAAPATYGKFILAKPGSDNISVIIDTVFSGGNDTVLVPVRALNLNNAGAVTLRINYNAALLNFIDGVELNSQLTGALIGQSGGVIAFAWDNTTGANLPNDKLFTLKFFNKGGGSVIPLNFLTAECEITDVYQNRLNVYYLNGAILPGLNITGKVTYANTQNTILPGVKVYLQNINGNVIDSTITDNYGIYMFTGKSAGTYKIICSSTKTWGGVNSTDALAIRRHIAGGPYLTGIYLTAADVNASGDANSTDALLIRKRLAFQVNSFPAGDWIFEMPLVSISSGSVSANIKAVCTGDVNGSYLPVAAKPARPLAYSNDGLLKIEAAKEFNVPVTLNMETAVNALYLVLNYPDNLIEFKGLTGKFDGALYSASEGNIYIAWDEIHSVLTRENEPVINLRFKLKANVKLEHPVYISLDPQSQIADLNGEQKENLKVMIPAVGINLPDKYDLGQNYPNPFNPVTNIKYALPFESVVTISVYNMLGQTVTELVSNVMLPAGYHNVQFNAASLSSGVYFYSIYAKSNDGTKHFRSVKKSILIK